MRLAITTAASIKDYDLQLKKISCYLPPDTLFIDRNLLTLDIVEKEKVDILIAANLSKEWCYLLRGLGVVTIIFGPREYYYELADLVIDYKFLGGSYYLTGPNFNFNHAAPELFMDVVGIIKKLDWDSKFFGFNIAYVSCLHLSENIMRIISEYVDTYNIRVIEYLCNCHDRRSVLIAEREGFSFVDIRLTFFRKLKDFKPSGSLLGFVFRKANDNDINELEKMAGQIYTNSRYYFDDGFGVSKAKEYYESWIRKAVKGEFDNECWCLIDGTKIVAFCSLRFSKSKHAQIGLIGVDEKFLGQGVGKKMIQNVMLMLSCKGFSELEVVTQGRNYLAQNLYQSVGFKTKETQLWYHKWR